GLTQDVMAHDTGRIPREISIAAPLNELEQRLGEDLRIAAANEVLSVYARGIRQRIVRTRADCLDGLARVEVVHAATGQRFAMGGIHDRTRLQKCKAGSSPGRTGRQDGGLALIQRYELLVFRADVIRGGPDDLVVGAL